MKISGIGGNRGPASARRSERTRRGGEAFAGMIDKPSSAAPTPAAGAIGPVGALLAVQEVPGATEEGRRGRARGDALLDELDQLRLALLAGRLPRATLERLSALVAARRERLSDPALAAILDEIELRAAVELAKYDARS